MPAPSALSYPTAPAFVVNQAITPLRPTVTGTVTSYTLSPALPAGLALSASTGVISGTPTAVTATASYTVTAGNSSGSTTASVSLTVKPQVGAPSISYASPAYSFISGVPAQTIVPTATGGAIASWGVSPALPAGLVFGTSDGSISGTPTAVAAAGTYTVTASNSGGQSSVKLNLAVSSAPLLDLGHINQVNLARASGNAALTQDSAGHWVLWNLTTGNTVASGNAPVIVDGLGLPYVSPVDLAGTTLAIQTATGLELRNASTGSVIAEIAASIPNPNITASWWKLASDGSYVCAGTTSGLTVWSTSGSMLFTVAGNYWTAVAFAAPNQVQVAAGPAGNNVVQNLAVPTGTATLTPAFQGQFQAWFADGGRFLTTLGGNVFVYSNAAAQLELLTPATTKGLGGIGNWFWTFDPTQVGLQSSGGLSLYAVGGSAQPVGTYGNGFESSAIASGTTVFLFGGQINTAAATILDLSGATPVTVNYTLPQILGAVSTYAAASSSSWFIGTDHGVVLKALAAPSGFQILDYGMATGIAGSSVNLAIATASGRILYFDAVTNTLQGTINAYSASVDNTYSAPYGSSIALSTNGSVLAAQTQAIGALYSNLNIYSLPGGGSINSLAPTPSGINGFTLSGSGTDLALDFVANATCDNEEIAATGGAPLWCHDTGTLTQLQLSADGTLVAASPAIPTLPQAADPVTTIHSGQTTIATVSGWVVGWLSKGNFLVDNFKADSSGYLTYAGSEIYNSSGNLQSSPALPQLASMQVVSATTIYGPQYNSIYSLATGAVTWTSGFSPGPMTMPLLNGAVSGSEVIFTSQNFVLAEPIN